MLDANALNELTPNPRNPRKITKEQFAKLKHAIETFGDISGVVFNERTGHLVGGHMRLETFKQLGGEPVIEETYETPTSKRTVARGYVLLDDEKFTYRRVDWSEDVEKAAMIAANAAGGDFDNDLLAEHIYEITQLENSAELLELTNVTDADIKKLLKSVAGDDDEDGKADDDSGDKLEFKLTREQREVVELAISHIINHREMAAEEQGSQNGSALYYMARDYIDRQTDLTPTEPPADEPRTDYETA